MNVKRIIKIERDIEHCKHQCPFYSSEGMEHIMICEHPERVEDGDFISRTDNSFHSCDTGFPEKCPMWKTRREEMLEICQRNRTKLVEKLKQRKQITRQFVDEDVMKIARDIIKNS